MLVILQVWQFLLAYTSSKITLPFRMLLVLTMLADWTCVPAPGFTKVIHIYARGALASHSLDVYGTAAHNTAKRENLTD